MSAGKARSFLIEEVTLAIERVCARGHTAGIDGTILLDQIILGLRNIADVYARHRAGLVAVSPAEAALAQARMRELTTLYKLGEMK